MMLGHYLKVMRRGMIGKGGIAPPAVPGRTGLKRVFGSRINPIRRISGKKRAATGNHKRSSRRVR